MMSGKKRNLLGGVASALKHQRHCKSVLFNQIEAAAAHWKQYGLSSSNAETTSQDWSVVLDVYRTIIQSDPPAAIPILDQQDYFQLQLWPLSCRLAASEKLCQTHCDASGLHALSFSVVMLFNFRWGHHFSRATDFLELFNRNEQAFTRLVENLFRLPLQSMSANERYERLLFLCHLFRSLDHESVSCSLLPLVSIPVWVNLSERARLLQLERFPYLQKPLSKLVRRQRKRSNHETAPLSEIAVFSVLLEIETEVMRLAADVTDPDLSLLCAGVCLVTELLSQVRLRRTVLPLLEDRVTLSLVQGLTLELRQLPHIHSVPKWADWLYVLDQFSFYTLFPIDPVTGKSVSNQTWRATRARGLLSLQRVAYSVSQREGYSIDHPLNRMSLATHGLIGTAEFLRASLSACSNDVLTELQDGLEVKQLDAILAGNTENTQPGMPGLPKHTKRKLLLSVLASHCRLCKTPLKSFEEAPLMMSENDIWGLQGAVEKSSQMALPTLNMEFLSVRDFLLRNYTLYRWDMALGIREDIENVVSRVQPGSDGSHVDFSRLSRMGLPILSVNVIDVGADLLDSPGPGHINVELEVDMRRLSRHAQQEWQELRPHEVLFLIKFPTGDCFHTSVLEDKLAFFSSCRLRSLIVGKARYSNRRAPERRKARGSEISLTIAGTIDSAQYQYDHKSAIDGADVFRDFHLAVRCYSETNRFFPVLASLRQLTLMDRPILPEWLEGIIIGRSTSKSSEYANASGNDNGQVDFVDTFVSIQHIESSFPTMTVILNPDIAESSLDQSCRYLHKILFADAGECGTSRTAVVKPYLGTFKRKVRNPLIMNSVRFNASQSEAVRQSAGRGLTVIAGPPGTGKTTCIEQIISNLYHSSPEQRTLLITRSNHGLNNIIDRLLLRNIDALDVLRLTQVESDGPFSELGRVGALLRVRLDQLSNVAILCESMGHDPTAWATTIETAQRFQDHFVEPLWKTFAARTEKSWQSFPFKTYLKLKYPGFVSQLEAIRSNSDVDEFSSFDEAYGSVCVPFDSLKRLRFLEVLRTTKQRADYVVNAHSRIIEISPVNAALRCEDLGAQGFRFDTLIVEGAVEYVEAEIIPVLSLQKTSVLKRVVLVGDHRQPVPVVRDASVRQVSNFSQSMLTRIVRLGYPVVHLSQQGRSRSSIADVFRWYHPGLTDMKVVSESAPFVTANPGFAYVAQFIDTGELSSEAEPLPRKFQNVAEAEYIAFTFVYMRLLGYPASKIALLATYEGQVQLLKEVVTARSAQYRNVGAPLVITTVDDFNGREADFVLLSLVRTQNLDHALGMQRLAVAFSRARFGLYIFGFHSLFSNCLEFSKVLERMPTETRLQLVADEMYLQFVRKVTDDVSSELCRMVHSPADMATVVAYMYSTKEPKLADAKDEIIT